MHTDAKETRRRNGSLKAIHVIEIVCLAVFVVISSYVLSEIFAGRADDFSRLAEIDTLFNTGCVLIGLFYMTCDQVCAWLEQRQPQSLSQSQ